MRSISRWSSVLAATALVGTSLTLAVPAMAVDKPSGDQEVAAVTVTEEVTPEETAPPEGSGEVAPVEEVPVVEEPAVVPEVTEEPAAQSEEPVELAPLAEVAAPAAEKNPTVAEARALADGTTVRTEGWVTASWATGGLAGFVIQSAGTGGECVVDGQSDAIFVYTNHSNNVAPVPEVGKYVEVSGKLATFKGLRQLDIGGAKNAPTAIKVIDDTAELKPATAITCAWPATEAQRESIESMLYRPTSEAGFAVTNNYDANTFGSLGISTTGAPLWQPSDVTADSVGRQAVADANAASSFILDDGATTRYAGGAGKLNTPPYVFADGSASVGADVTFTQDLIVDYRNDKWTLNPTTPILSDGTSVTSDLPATFSYERPAAPTVAGDLVVGGFNLENYFPTQLGAGWWSNFCTSYNDNVDNPITVRACESVTSNGVTTQGPRGAWTQAMLDIQTNRLVTAINDLDAAALGVMELENSFKLNFGSEAQAGASAAYLVDALNKAAGSDKWAYVTPAGAKQQAVDQQDVMYPGIIYQPAKVTPVVNGQLTLSGQSGDGQAFSNARAPFGQAFVPTDGGEPFFLVANHFKSKSSPGEGDNADLGEGGWNPSRIAQATALAEWANGPALTTLKRTTGITVEDVVLVGDFNSYTWEQPMQVLYNAGFVNSNIGADGKPIQASYNYSGLNGSLDHVLISKSTSDRLEDHAIWNVNAPEQIGLHYSRYDASGGGFVQAIDAMGVPNRSSDHDPAVVGLSAGTASADVKEITLFNSNDFHGRIDGKLAVDNKDNHYIADPTDGKFDTMKFAYTLEALRAAVGVDKSVFISAGDTVGASLFPSSLQNDQPTIDLMNALKLKVMALGNHEFDQGVKDIDRLAKEFDATLVAANVFKDNGELLIDPYYTFEQNGLKIAVIGAVTQETPTLVNPSQVAGVKFTDPVEAVNKQVAELTKAGGYNPDVIIAAYHEGAPAGEDISTLEEQMAESPVFAKIVKETDPRVDAIFNAHTHKVYAWNGPVPGSKDGATRPIMSSGQYGDYIGMVTLSVSTSDEDSSVVSYTQSNIPTSAAGGLAAGKTMTQLRDFNAATKASYDIILDALINADTQGNKPAGALAGIVSRAYTGGEYVDGKWQKAANSSEDRGNASPMGTLVGNMLLRGTMSTVPDTPDFGVTNPGGLRTDLTPDANGMITVAQARSVLPFNNELATVKMTGEQVIKMLEEQWQRDASGAIPSRDFLYLGLSDNFQYTYHQVEDPAHPGAMIGVIDSVTINGEALDPAKTYVASTFTFLAAGGDNFHVFKDSVVNASYGYIDYQSWLDYLKSASGCNADFSECKTPIEPNFARQGVEVVVPADLEAGSQATIQYKNMNIHAIGAPANTKVTVTSGTTELGTAEVTNTLDGAKWTDSASISFRVPSDTNLTLVGTAEPTKTTMTTRTKTAPKPAVDVRRLAGVSRYNTNVAVNNASGDEKGGIVFVATGMDYADSLSAAPAAAVTDGKVFLTAPAAMPAETLNAIKKLEPSRVYIIGGQGAVSTNVSNQLTKATGVFTTRISGADRYETSARVFQTFFQAKGADLAFVATGLNYPDALSASAAAGALEAPVLLVNGNVGRDLLPQSTQLLKRLGATDVVIAGGPAVVNKTIETNLNKSFKTTRLYGIDRFQTNLAVNEYLNTKVGDTATSGVWVATGLDFPDALSAAVPAGDATQRLVLSNGKCISKPIVSEWINGADSKVTQVTLVGGTGVLPAAMMKLPECK